MPAIDSTFSELPHRRLGEAALTKAGELRAGYADFRLERHRTQQARAHDTNLESLVDDETVGYGVRVVHGGAWGFASSVTLTTDGAAGAAARAVDVAKALASLNREPVELAPEPAHQGTYLSHYEIDPFAVPDDEKVGFLLAINEQVLRSGRVDHVDFDLNQVLEGKYFASLDGADITQQRVRTQGNFQAVGVDKKTGAFETMRSCAAPTGRGWEHFAGGYDYAREAEQVPELVEEKLRAPSVEPGRYDLVLDPTNLWLTIHESVGHATELDRVLGHEANYAGTSFATADKLNRLRYGSEMMHVTGDRIAAHGLSTVGFDDEGVEAQQWDLIRHGVLVGYQLNRHMAAQQGWSRSNGCAFADAPQHLPLQRMPNISLQPSADDVSLEDLIGGVDRGIYVVGDKSWSIDMQRYNFQFTGQRFYEIRGGRLAGQLKDVGYQASTTEFWNALDGLGGPSTYVLGGAFNCGKGQPSQIAPVSHGCPPARFRNIRILNTGQEGSS